jgi:hypothetical protein
MNVSSRREMLFPVALAFMPRAGPPLTRPPGRRDRDAMIRSSSLIGRCLAAGLLAITALVAAQAPSDAATGCQATYTIGSQWSGGFTASVSITNLGSAVTSWTAGWTFPGNQQVTQLWNGAVSQSGANVSVANESYNGSVATNATVTFGFNGSVTGSNAAPAQLTFNGTVCTGAVSSSPTPSATPTPTPTPTPTQTTTAGHGTWTAAPVNPGTGGAATFLWLLSDGTILSNGANLNQWVKLVPDSHGSYANGTWVTLADSPYGMGAAQEHILPDGRFYQAGGEYIYQYPSGSSTSDHDAVQLYDPVTNTWTLGQQGLYGNLDDSGSATLSNGSIVSSDISTAQTQIFSPTTNSWTGVGPRPSASGEDGWVTLPGGGTVISMSTYGQYSFNTATNAWTTLPAAPSGYANGGVDPATTTLMYNGKILVMGGSSSAVYTPGGGWATGPGMPQGSYVDDSYATPEPNGNVLFDTVKCSWLTGACGSASGPELVEYDPTTNTMSTISEPPDSSGQAVNFIDLPDGQVLAAAGARDWIYTPVGSPQSSWRPTVTSVTSNGNGSYHLSGTQLTGFVSTGEDDFQDPQNFPIVYLTDSSGDVYYARTSNFSTMAPSTPGEAESADFTLPSGLPHGTYSLYVSSCGVSSAAGYSFTY